MIDCQAFHQIRQLCDREHLSATQIAAALQLDERTVGKWIDSQTYQPRAQASICGSQHCESCARSVGEGELKCTICQHSRAREDDRRKSGENKDQGCCAKWAQALAWR